MTGESFTVAVLKAKINSIRSQYMENINKIRKSKVSGAATDEVYKPKWWLFPELSFLDPVITIRKGESSITPKNKASCEKLDSFGQIKKEGKVDIVDLL